ncbi:IS982 family transposase [Catenovulum sp. 2E275]|uniref:IS982 family transposase n=1 Tax=Catenovulum sp. 2E275 TaxID=2980497 RepID=UPI0021D0A456|nr:IS982 family transposase [Catenovulum sp. 2E275]MCU4677281.1 IS982 family transposase [Catenovulum sp. 2E275]
MSVIADYEGGLLAVKVTPGNVDDRKPVLEMAENITGSLYADKGYISKDLQDKFGEQGINFVTGKRKNMKQKPLSDWDKAMLSKRFIIETVFDQLKNMAQIEHSRHRSCIAFMVNLMAGLIAYTFQEKKPSIKVTRL